MSRPLLAILSAALCSATLIAQDSTLPRFRDFAVRDTYQAKPVERIHAQPGWAEGFGQSLGASPSGPNFAGQFTLVRWGCGSSCIMYAVVSAKTGRVYSRQCRPKLARRFTYRARY